MRVIDFDERSVLEPSLYKIEYDEGCIDVSIWLTIPDDKKEGLKIDDMSNMVTERDLMPQKMKI